MTPQNQLIKQLPPETHQRLNQPRRKEVAESFGTVRKFYLPIIDADKYGEKITP